MNSRRSSDISPALSPRLNPIEELPEGYFAHPEVPGKVTRWIGDTVNIIDELPYVQDHLEKLQAVYHVPTVNTQFIVSDVDKRYSNTYDDVAVVMVSDKIEGAVSAEDALEYAQYNEEIADEFDALSCRFLKCLGDVAKQGGVYMPDLYYYSQCVFDPTRNEGERLVLVDTEPIAVFMEEDPRLRIKGSVPLTLLLLVADVAKDIIHLQQRTGRISNAQLRLTETIDNFDPEGYASIELLKQAIVAGVRRNDESLFDFTQYRYENLEPSEESMHSFEGIVDSGMPVSMLKRQGRL